MKKILYSLLFIYSSVFALNVSSGYGIYGSGNDLSVLRSNGDSHSVSNHITYNYSQAYVLNNNDVVPFVCDSGYYLYNYNSSNFIGYFSCLGVCDSGLEFDEASQSCSSPPPSVNNPIISSSTDGNLSIYIYSDGSTQFCSSVTQTCSTLDSNGNSIPNLPINGTTYNSISDVVTNRFLSIGGIIVSSLGAAAIVVGSAGFGTPAAVATLSTGGIFGGLALGGTAFTGNDPFLLPESSSSVPTNPTSGALKINLMNMDFSKPDPEFTKSTTSQGYTEYARSLFDGTKETVTTTANDVIVSKESPDSSSTKYIVPKSLFSSTPKADLSKNNYPTPVTVKKIVTPAPTIKNDGSKVWHSDIVYNGTFGFGVKTVWSKSTTVPHNISSVSSTDSSTTSTSTSTSTSSNGTTSTSTSTNDYSPITNRLNQLINQHTLLNTHINSMDSKLDVVNNNLDNINTNLTDISNSLKDDGSVTPGTSTLINTNIDTTTFDDTSSVMDNLATNVKDLTDGITSIKTQFDSTKTLINGGAPAVSIPSGGCTNVNLRKFGSYIAPYSGIVALITYVTLMISIFKMIFSYYARGEN